MLDLKTNFNFTLTYLENDFELELGLQLYSRIKKVLTLKEKK